MGNKKKLLILALQIVIFAVFIFSYKSYADSTTASVSVYVFANDLPQGRKIDAKDLVLSSVSKNDYNSSMILESEGAGALGKFLNTTVYSGNIAYKGQFSNISPSEQELSGIDTTNSRLITLPVSLADCGGFFKTGDTVDLIYTAGGSAELSLLDSNGNDLISDASKAANSLDMGGGQSTNFSYSKTFLYDLVIYDVLTSDGYKYISKEGRYNGDSVNTVVVEDSLTADAGTIGYIMLIVTPEQCEEISVRAKNGTISVAKRFANSETHETMGYVLGDYGKVFAGQANAETGSLQIVSTTSDTDYSNNTSITTSDGSTEVNTNNEDSVSAVAGGLGVE